MSDGKRPRPRRRGPARDASGAGWTVISRSLAETDRLGRRIARVLRGGEPLALSGELGAGKTTLVRSVAAGLGAPPQAVSSPTFVLVQEYPGRLRLVHADLYRIESPAHLRELGLGEALDPGSVLMVEWAEKAGDELPPDRLEVHLRHLGQRRREVRFYGTGPRSRALLARIRAGDRPPRRPAAQGD
ncbi:tRNA (adenosine(37)-N6)-threonylcarbamoyltransferase complex ATPase subunit type 1 TsaE [Nitrospira sp. Kam-Ns4a]